MVENRVELIMDFISKQQARLVSYMCAGFVIGFIIGVVAAWAMIALGH